MHSQCGRWNCKAFKSSLATLLDSSSNAEDGTAKQLKVPWQLLDISPNVEVGTAKHLKVRWQLLDSSANVEDGTARHLKLILFYQQRPYSGQRVTGKRKGRRKDFR